MLFRSNAIKYSLTTAQSFWGQIQRSLLAYLMGGLSVILFNSMMLLFTFYSLPVVKESFKRSMTVAISLGLCISGALHALFVWVPQLYAPMPKYSFVAGCSSLVGMGLAVCFGAMGHLIRWGIVCSLAYCYRSSNIQILFFLGLAIMQTLSQSDYEYGL